MADITLFHKSRCSVPTGTDLASNQAFLPMSPLNHSYHLHLHTNIKVLKKYPKFYIVCQ